MDHDIELRLQRIAGHAKRGWKGDAARELGVTTRTIHRALTGYLPESLRQHIEDLERRRDAEKNESVLDVVLRKSLTEATPPDDAKSEKDHYRAGLADGFWLGVTEIRKRSSEEDQPLIQRLMSQRNRERPAVREAREAQPPGTISGAMLRRVADHFEKEGEMVDSGLRFYERTNIQRQIDQIVMPSIQRIADAIWRHGQDDARRVAEIEEKRLIRDLAFLFDRQHYSS
ncbi:hypothetical protein PARHAE_03274 [Paracoccus haematequi]|uniref:Uncharacterized protein n=1 Tax=Paracoccus haematequi TaxID=2491866 RepID=A0A3S4DY41_9RHOB|nr:hypothetical protein [Paracoccus haematequi]VDS10063.1 hypothetical protein PARHAE_03274 [Paracoccus haematequi]